MPETDTPEAPERDLSTAAGLAEFAMTHQRWLADIEARGDDEPMTDAEREQHDMFWRTAETAQMRLTAAGELPQPASASDVGEITGETRDAIGQALADVPSFEPRYDAARMFTDAEYRLEQGGKTIAAWKDVKGHNLELPASGSGFVADLAGARMFAALRADGRGAADLIAARKAGTELYIGHDGGISERALQTGVATDGGNWLPTEFETALYTTFYNFAGVRQCNPYRDMTPDGRDKDYPTIGTIFDPQAGRSTPNLTAEMAQYLQAEDDTTKITSKVYKATARIELTTEMMSDSAVELSGYVGDSMGRTIAQIVEYAGLFGNGNSEPDGIMHTSNVAAAQTYTMAANDEMTYGDFMGWLEKSPEQLNDEMLKALLKRQAWFKILQEKGTDGHYIIPPSHSRTTRALQDVDIFLSMYLPALAATKNIGALGDWMRGMIYREVDSLVVMFDPYSKADQGVVKWLSHLRFDWRIRDPKVFTWLATPA